MSKLKTCKTCGQEIAKNAKVCPHCGAKQKGSPLLSIILALVCIGVIGAVIGGDTTDKPTKVGSTEPIPEEVKQTVFFKGDTVALNDVNVTLIDVVESKGQQFLAPTNGNVFVTFEVEIANNSQKDVTVSSLLMFEAYFDDYAANLSISAIANAEKTQLDGTVAAGKKMRGVVGYEAPKDWKVAELKVTPDFWKRGDISFQYTK